MAESTIWWLLAGTAVAIELATGTFYLLMLGIGMVAAAISAHLGVPVTGQIITAAIVGGGAVALWHWRKSKQPKSAPVNANPDVHIDIGEPVQVERWNADGTASVKYRGANWTAVLATPAPDPLASPASPGIGQFRIKEMLGNRLVIEKL
ncbi:MAG: NfeD family protein [Pseudomonadota bacterium]